MPQSNEKWLSIDLSTRSASLALHQWEEGKALALLACETYGEDLKHSELLLTWLGDLLTAQSLSLDSISRLVTSSGPGSFTGLRIALSSLKAIAQAKQLPLELVSNSEARARAFRTRNQTAQSLVIVTRVGAGSYAIAELKGEDFKENVPLSGEFVLVDSLSSQEHFSAQGIQASAVFPSHAEYLGETLLQCTSRQTFRTTEELITAAPNYFGASRF